MKARIKTSDGKPYTTYKDQRGTEIYDNYDLQSNETVPQMIEDAIVNDESKVTIDYPTDGMFNLNGDAGYATAFGEWGKKAYVRGGGYRHPTKEYSVRLTRMRPMEYIERCYNIFKSNGRQMSSIENFIKGRELDYDLSEVFGPLEGNISYPVIDYVDKGQEGLHRAIYAMNKGIDLIPVIVRS